MSHPYGLRSYEEVQGQPRTEPTFDQRPSYFDLCWLTALAIPIFAIAGMASRRGRWMFARLARELPPDPEVRTGWELPRDPKGPEHPRTGWDDPER
jgi:hypothetical protein